MDAIANDQPILVETDGGVMVLTLNRPAAKNAVDRALAYAMAEALEMLDDDDRLRVGIITGAGATFCAGMDLKGFLAGEIPIIDGKGFAGLTMAPPKKPLIAAVDGYALAGGMEIALACDLIVANRDAKFGIPEVKRGLVAAARGLVRLPRQISPRLAMELALTGDFIGAERAYEIGLINRISEGPALDEAKKLAATIKDNGPLAVKVSKQIISRQREWHPDDMWEKQCRLIGPVMASDDAREGAAAFAEKRKPIWSGK